jgi:elongation factor P--(R)-beta-lysine ligase
VLQSRRPIEAVMDWRPTAPIANLAVRARMLQAARSYFGATRALEVETPTLSRAAVSDLHIASIEARVLGQRRYLHTSPEYPMKRLLAHGCGDLWQICRVYRDEECGRWHNPEFTLLEWYRIGMDHHALMTDVEALVRAVLEPARPLPASERLTYRDAVRLHAGVDALDDPLPRLVDCLHAAHIDVPAGMHSERDACLDLIMSTLVIPRLGRSGLAFVYDYPASQAALARSHGAVAARFEAFLDGLELANGYHELCDAAEQRQRFQQDQEQRAAAGRFIAPLDEALLQALAHGMPECAGVALGFDRLVMCAVGAQHIEEVLAFGFARA